MGNTESGNVVHDIIHEALIIAANDSRKKRKTKGSRGGQVIFATFGVAAEVPPLPHFMRSGTRLHSDGGVPASDQDRAPPEASPLVAVGAAIDCNYKL